MLAWTQSSGGRFGAIRPALSAGLAITLALLGGCTRQRALRLWAANDMLALADRTPNRAGEPFFDAQRSQVQLHSAANETVSFQLVIDAAAPISNVRCSAGSLSGPGGAKLQAVRLFRMLPVAVKDYPAWYLRLADAPVQPQQFYDPLAPIDAPRQGQPFELASGSRLAVWVDLEVPRDALPGDYTGAVTVSAGLPGNSEEAAVNIRLRVDDFVLPDQRAVTCLGAFSWQSVSGQFVTRNIGGKQQPFLPVRLETDNRDATRTLTIIRQLMQLAHAHRLDLVETSLVPVLKRDAAGAVQLDWHDYDLIVKPYLDGTAFDDRLAVPAWPAPFSAAWPEPGNYGGAGSKEYRQTALAVLGQSAAHFQAMGMADKLFIWPRPESADAAEFCELARLARSASQKMPILSELPTTAPAEAHLSLPADMPSLADMLAPPANLLAVTTRPAATSPLAGNYLRPGLPPFIGWAGVLASPADVRVLGYLASRYGAGIFLGDVLNWSGDPLGAAAGAQTRLFYPGSAFGLDEVLPSVRLKRLRRGLQDAAYLDLLRQRNRPGIAAGMLGILVRYAAGEAAGDNYLDGRLEGYVRDGQAYADARDILAQEVLRAVHPEQATPQEMLRQRLAWQDLQQRCCRIRLERSSCQLEPLGQNRYRLRASLELLNELSLPADLELRPLTLPPGWTFPAGQAIIAAMPPGEMSRLELVFEGQGLPTSADGKMDFCLTLQSKARPDQPLLVSLPILQAPYATRPPVIDGDLADWPIRGGNTAGAFVLLGRRGRCGENQAGLAVNATSVFAQYDDHNIYLAFRCAQPSPPQAEASNQITYEQLLACGEDLVEALFDPTGRAGSSDELYHLAVKCNGSALAQRGVSTDPPLGAGGPWPVQPKVAVAQKDKVYFVEMAIPLASFGQTPPTMWKANFSRFCTAGQESSNWAGAPRYIYNGRDLGYIIFLPPPG